MAVVRLDAAPSLAPLLARGALRSPLKRAAEGAVAPPTRLVLRDAAIDRGRLAAYREVCGFPVSSTALPVTYPHILGFPLAMRLMAAREFPLPLLGLVHTAFTVDQHRPLTAEDRPELTVYASELSPHRRGTEATLVTEARLAGELVWESRSTYLARHATSYEGPLAPERTDNAPLPVRAEWDLPGDLGRRYGAASGDRNPIHLHPLTARLFGFPRAIAHGMWTVARCLAEHGAPGTAGVRAEFRAPVLLPGRVAYGADGERFELRGPGGRLHLSGGVVQG
ncbi:MaoC/PaaZ C-terminal domain-containing protein [Streptomyces sp. B-S-A8]|uniref:MaoC/PaaZ C-terminal domain-containing protein n=1 Tax=Streptomyces solicavernae TaxID=3043614 RepID=A0ABT6RN57_9ACTN|nr:MaoC/PaaZ C-terminal domain-containing protein [Streptomyces sp. B-S-A8]MDI3385863.1 MaoC/PaaZ C-terminal domain-containing protein [Streptomyces sp. B-S-A8]